MNIKNALAILCLILAVIANGNAFGQGTALPPEFGPHTWTANVKVVDEDGTPVTGANVAVQYTVPAQPGSGQPQYGEIKGLTDNSGMFSASHTDSSLGLAIIIDKSGYYTTHSGHQFYFDEKNRHPTFTLLLRKIGKPIAMYARQVQIEIPVVGEAVGFDLIKYDWVAPYGKGQQNDIVFEAHRRWVSRHDFDATVKIKFLNPSDGLAAVTDLPIQGSSGPQIPVTAPLDGYIPDLEVGLGNTPNGGWNGASKTGNYYLRIRSELDANGNVKSALYGKIYGGFTLDPINSKTTFILFTYYLNPTLSDRNTEFDPSRNLFKNLPAIQQVKAP